MTLNLYFIYKESGQMLGGARLSDFNSMAKIRVKSGVSSP